MKLSLLLLTEFKFDITKGISSSMISDSFATFEILIECTFFVVSPFLQLLMVTQEHSQHRLIILVIDNKY